MLVAGGVVGMKGAKPRYISLACRHGSCAIKEETDIPYKSKIDGVMHACGHMRIQRLIGHSRVLSLSGMIYGTIKFIFQPFEEGSKGAQRMIDEGVRTIPAISDLWPAKEPWCEPKLYGGRRAGIIYGTAFMADRFTVDIKVVFKRFNAWAEQEIFQ